MNKKKEHLWEMPTLKKNQNTMVTKDWTTVVGLARLSNTAHKPILLINGDISKEQVATYKKKMHTVLKQNDID